MKYKITIHKAVPAHAADHANEYRFGNYGPMPYWLALVLVVRAACSRRVTSAVITPVRADTARELETMIRRHPATVAIILEQIEAEKAKRAC